MGKLAITIQKVQATLNEAPQEQLKNAERAFNDITYQDLFMYQEIQSRAFASGLLEQADSQLIYTAIGEGCSVEHWQKNSLATKVVITQVISKLAEIQILQAVL